MGDAKEKRTVLAAATMTSFMTPFMISAVNVALPAIGRDFGADAATLGWVATAFLLSSAVFLIPFGRYGDNRGRLRLYRNGLAVFSAGSLLCLVARSAGLLIFGRAVQGIGSAMLYSTGLALIMTVFPPGERGRAIGISVAATYAGLTAGPLGGGFLAQQFGWRSIFLVSLVLGLAALAAVRAYLTAVREEPTGEPLDLPGALLWGVALVLLMGASSRLPEREGFALLAAGLVAAGGFLRRAWTAPFPIFDLGLYAGNRVFACASAAALLHYGATYAVTFLLSLYLQYVKGFRPDQAGLLLAVQPACMALLSPFTGALSDRVEPAFVASAGMALTAAGLVLFAGLGPETPAGSIVAALAVVGVGYGLFSSPNMNSAMGAVEKRRYGMASAALAAMRLLGQMMSMGITLAVFGVNLGRANLADPAVRPLFLAAMRHAFILFAVLCGAGIVLSLARRPRPG